MNDTRRDLQGFWLIATRLLFASLPIISIFYAFQILPRFGIVLFKEQFLITILTISLALVLITVPPTKTNGTGAASKSVPWYDMILVVLIVLAGGYTAGSYHILVQELGLLTTDKIVVSVIGVVVLLEATRRVAGPMMMSIGLVALSYAYFGHHLDGLFETRVIRLDRLFVYNYMNPGSIHGVPIFVAATIVTLFILFGQTLFAVGAGQAISDFTFALIGRRRGGAAKVSVVASALFGSLSGSASANVATTGMVTIPMMEKTGYRNYQAAAIEAVASTGGLVLPPIMAATGFIMAEFLSVPYADIAKAAVLPALLFYFCVFLQVDLEARKSGLSGWQGEEVSRVWPALKAVVPVVIPVAVLLYALFGAHRSAEAAACFATIATVAISLIVPAMRRPLTVFLDVIVNTGKAVVFIVVVTAIAGLVMGCLGLTGLGANLSQKLVEVADGNIMMLLVLSAFGSIVLGMGVPVTATYIILVILVGPALVSVGVPELAAHMFVFYYGTLSFLTPPVAISVFVAAAIAKSGPMRTAFYALRLAVIAYIIPFLFVFDQRYLLIGSGLEITQTIVAATCGIFFLSFGLVGYAATTLSVLKRAFCVGTGALVLWLGPSNLVAVGVSCALLVIYFAANIKRLPNMASSGGR